MKHSYMDNRDVLNQPIQAHKLLFGLMYGTRVDLSNYELRSVFECIANATAYAQYYGLMDLVRVPLRQRYEALKGLFKHIAEEPLFHALLARHLKSVLGFQEAARHLVGGFAMYEQAPLDSAAYKDLKILVYEKRHVLHDEVTSLMSRIRRELLSSRPVKSNSGKTVVGSTPTKFLDGRNKKRGWRECCRFLAQSMVSQWILDELEKTTYNECQAASKSNGYPSEMLTMM